MCYIMRRTIPEDAPNTLHFLPEAMYKPSSSAPRQLTFSDFNQSCGMQLVLAVAQNDRKNDS